MLVHDHRVCNDTGYRDQYAKNTLVSRLATTDHPAESNDGARLQVSNNRAANRSCSGDDEKLRDVDQTGEASALQGIR